MSSNLLAVDPGLRVCGIAYFNNGTLSFCVLVRNPEREARGPMAWMALAQQLRAVVPPWCVPDTVVLEVPQVYVIGRGKGDPADLIELAGVDGAIAAQFPDAKHLGYRPRDWKGSVPKDVHQARVLKTLSEADKRLIEESSPASLRHNVIDAVALGAWFLKKNRSLLD